MKNGRKQTPRPPTKEMLEDASKAGVEVLYCTPGKHWKVHIRAPDGRECFIVTHITPGDHRARLNSVALMKRFAKGGDNGKLVRNRA